MISNNHLRIDTNLSGTFSVYSIVTATKSNKKISKLFNIEIGCTGETYLDHRLATGHSNPNVLSLTSDHLIFVYPRTSALVTEVTIPLNGTVEWFSNIAGCGAYIIHSYTDSACTIITNS